jgi:hypothetical protein
MQSGVRGGIMDKRITPPDAGNVGVDGALNRVGENGFLGSNYSTPAGLEAKANFRHCSICGGRFTPDRVNHTICDECLSHPQVSRSIDSIRGLMAEVAA